MIPCFFVESIQLVHKSTCLQKYFFNLNFLNFSYTIVHFISLFVFIVSSEMISCSFLNNNLNNAAALCTCELVDLCSDWRPPVFFVKMGLARLFTPEADLSGISSRAGLHISKMKQKCHLVVGENGVEASSTEGKLDNLISQHFKVHQKCLKNFLCKLCWPKYKKC